jgi:hypothetical protein
VTLDERKALSHLIAEARKARAVLYRPARAFLPPSIILGVMRKDGFTCQMHGDRGEEQCKGLMIHRISDVVPDYATRFARNLNDRQNLITVCRAGYEDCVDPKLASVRAHDLVSAVKTLIDRG